MNWSEISVHTTQEAIEAVANILYEAGSEGVIIEDPEILDRDFDNQFGEIYDLSPDDFPNEGVIVKGYLPVNSYIKETIEQLKLAINNLTKFDLNIGDIKLNVSNVNEEDWASSWKKYYKPVRISERFWITPTWEKVAEKTDLIIELDPGMAFGTGTHPTTVMSIRALETIINGNEEVIDVGCGSGVLSIAAAKLGAKNVLALDLDEIAVNSTKYNLEVNDVESTVDVRQNNLLNNIDKKADVIVANILAEIILRFTSDVGRILKDEGYFIVSGVINSKATIVEANLQENGFTIVKKLEDQEWVTIIAKKL